MLQCYLKAKNWGSAPARLSATANVAAIVAAAAALSIVARFPSSVHLINLQTVSMSLGLKKKICRAFGVAVGALTFAGDVVGTSRVHRL